MSGSHADSEFRNRSSQRQERPGRQRPNDASPPAASREPAASSSSLPDSASRIPCFGRLVRYHEVRHEICDGDLLLFRDRGPIAVAGRGVHVHAAKAAWWHEDLFCLETRWLLGSRAVTLSSQVRRYPGRIDVFEVNPQRRWPEYDRRGAVRFMRRLAGRPYGYSGLAAAALLHLPVIRWFVRPNTDDGARDHRPPFCSQACAAADRIGGGVDPVPQLADRLTEPADLARSPFYRYRFTLKL